MKNKMVTIIFIAVFFMLPNLCISSESVRPIQIQVVDSKTKAPVTNVLVYYAIRTLYSEKAPTGNPEVDSFHYRYKSVEKYQTDSNGFVFFPQKSIQLDLYEYLQSEQIFINLDIKDKYVGKEQRIKSFLKYFSVHDVCNVEKIFNPSDQYKGFVIYSTKRTLDSNKIGGSDRQKFNIIWNGEGLNRQNESIVVKLVRW